MHYQMRVWNQGMNGSDTIHREDLARGFASKFVGAVARADGNGERIHMCRIHKIACLFRVSEQHIVGQFTDRADAVFLAGFACFERA